MTGCWTYDIEVENSIPGWLASKWLSRKSITLTFTETSPWEKSQTQMVRNHEIMKFRWKSRTQIMKVADTNYLDMSRCLRQSLWQVRNEPVCVVLMEFSPLQCTGKVGNKVGNKVHDTNHKSRRHDLCRGLSWLVSVTLSQSWRNGIWALLLERVPVCRHVNHVGI